MKFAQFSRFGPPTEVIEICEADPEPLGLNDVRVSIEAAPVHIADLMFISGALPFYKELPGTPGMEGVGRVVETGSSADRFKDGDRVFLPVRVGEKGGFRTEVVLHESQVIPAPDGDAVQLCLMPINGLTAFTILRGVVPLKPGDVLLQNAANSNCGRYIIALAHKMGVETVNVVRRPELVEELKALGADHVLVDGDDLAARVRDAVDGRPITYALDAVAGSATQRIADSVADGALILSYGLLSGDPCTIRPETLFFRNLTLKGFLTFTYFDVLPQEVQDEAWRELPALIAAGAVTANIAATYSLDEIRSALAHAAKRGAERDGKVIVLPNG